MKTEITHPAIGAVTVCKTRRARRVSISVRPAGVRLTLPCGVSVAEGVRFLESRADWVVRAREKVAAKAPAPQPVEMPYSTRSHDLRLCPADREGIRMRLIPSSGGRSTIEVAYPACVSYLTPGVQQAIRKGIVEAWRAEARSVLPGRVAALAAQHGLSYRSVTVRNTRTRWGSCSTRNDLSLSIRLMTLPDHLIDYIILHELCHTLHKNHGPRFHALLDQLTCGQHPSLRRQMRDFRSDQY